MGRCNCRPRGGLTVAQQPIDADLRSSGKKFIDGVVVAMGFGVVALVAYGLYRAFAG